MSKMNESKNKETEKDNKNSVVVAKAKPQTVKKNNTAAPATTVAVANATTNGKP